MAKKLTTNVVPSRSGNPDYKELDKLDDVTRFNTSSFNVAFYKNSPNRNGTPLPPHQSVKRPTRVKKALSPKEKYLGEIIKKAPFIEEIYRNALNFKPRNTSVAFSLVRHRIKTNTAVYNDYHIRETNSGYARNGYGGYYTK
jgi:hypothetical protein